MPDVSPVLGLPLIQPAQAQKHVTHNEALRLLDVLVQPVVLDRSPTPPATPAEGDRHIVAPGATGAWAGRAGRIAVWEGGVWAFHEAQPGWSVQVLAEGGPAVFTGLGWETAAERPLQVARLGVATAADAVNRLAVAGPATLLTGDGAGHQLKVNKAAAGDTASLLFQTGWSGRAEIGTVGGDALAFKVSADGATFHEGLRFDAGSGRAVAPAGASVAAGTAAAPGLAFDGDADTGLFRAGADQIALAAGGVERLRVGPAGVQVDVPVTGLAVAQSATDTTAGRLLTVGAGHQQLDATLYRRGNAVGTVGQSGGTPTGAVVERGSNANGDYVRHADGTQICWHGLTGSASAGAGWTFPAAFAAAPRVTGTAVATVLSCVMADAAPTATAVTLSARDKTDARRADPMQVTATGRWY